MTIPINLEGRVAVVTGALGGIGQAITRRLEEAGARVAVLDLAGPSGDGPESLIECDVTSPASVEQAAAIVMSTFGHVDIVVNNAGVAARTGMPFTRLNATDWQRCWDVNVVGTFNVSAAFADQLIASDSGSIVNIASVSGRTGFQTSPPYSASKAAVINFTQVMAKDLAVHGVRVNAICPGMVFTPFYHSQRIAAAERNPELLQVSDEQFFDDKARSLIPLGRGQQTEDIANAVIFLSSELAHNITGQSLNVDGGLVMS
jgi:2-hydroxycyclohexanecarboxyl-CoA dehydrogenase